MNATLYNDKGEAVEAITQEELDQKVQEEREAAIAETNQNREEEIENLMNEKEELEKIKTDLEAKIEGAEDKDKNLAGQRKALDKKEKEIEGLSKKITELEGTVNTKIQEVEKKLTGKDLEILFEKAAGDDSDLKDKIQHFYDQFTGEPKTKEEMEQRVNNALTLASGDKKAKPLSGRQTSSAGGGGINPMQDTKGQKLDNPAAIEVAKQLGISDKELKEQGLI